MYIKKYISYISKKFLNIHTKRSVQLFRMEQILREIEWGQIFSNTIIDCKWLKFKALSPGRWAANYSFLYIIFRIINENTIQSILEFGLGQTTILTSQYVNENVKTEHDIIEHDQSWIDSFCNKYGFVNKMNIHKVGLIKEKYRKKLVLKYDLSQTHIGLKKYNLILIDGPYGDDYLSRSNVLDVIPNSLSSQFIIIIDDCQRNGEMRLVVEICIKLNENNIEYLMGEYYGAKKQVLLCSPNYKFMTSL